MTDVITKIAILNRQLHELTIREVEVLMFLHMKLPIEGGDWLHEARKNLVSKGYITNVTDNLSTKALDFIEGYHNLTLQERITIWARVCFIRTGIENNAERAYRFAEEAIELVQSFDVSVEDMHKLVDYVYNRPVGETDQEVGGTYTTLAVLSSINNLKIDECATTELDRIWMNIPKIRKRNETKPQTSVEVKQGDTVVGIDAAGGLSISTTGDVNVILERDFDIEETIR